MHNILPWYSVDTVHSLTHSLWLSNAFLWENSEQFALFNGKMIWRRWGQKREILSFRRDMYVEEGDEFKKRESPS